MNGAFRSVPQIARPAANVTCCLRSQDQIGELAAAFDGLAESLKEKSGEPYRHQSLQPFFEPWFGAFSRFFRALRLCRDSRSIQDLLMTTVEQLFPHCAVAFSTLEKGRCVEPDRCRKHEQDLKRLMPTAEIEKDRTVARTADLKVVPEPQNLFRRSKAEEWRKGDRTSCARISLIAGGKAWGTLSVFAKERRKLSRLEFEFLTLLADEAAVTMHHVDVHQKMEEQKVQLQEARDALRHAQSPKPEFLSILSHEFRTPLNLIMGYTEIMQEELVESITAEQRGYLKRIMNASEDILALVLSVLHVGSIEAGCVDVLDEEVRLGTLLEELRSDLELPEEKHLDFVWEVPADLPVIRTDAEKLKYILHQLIDNAVKFTEHGEVKVSSKSLSRLGKVEIMISDTGVGIPNDALPSVFEKYRQLDGSMARMYDGMGVGLFRANKFTAMLGGELKVESEPGKGSTFTVVLPASVSFEGV